MVGNGNHPLDDRSHIDEVTLEEYVLGQLLPNQEQDIQEHLAQCAFCRARVAEYRAACRKLASDLKRELDDASPGPKLDFDQIATQWRKPRRQFNFRYRVQQLVPSLSLVLVLSLLIMSFIFLYAADDTTALQQLDLVEDYSGPSAMVAVTTDSGLVIARLDDSGSHVVTRLTYARDARNLRFAPSGDWIAFQEDGTLHILDCSGGGTHVRVAVEDTAEWAWSPDSAMLAYSDGTGQLFVFDVTTQLSRVIVPAEESVWGKPIWSKDGTQIAYSVVMPLPSSGDTVQRQGVWRVDPMTGYRAEVARNIDPDHVLLAPTEWVNGTANVLVWDYNAVQVGIAPTLYWIDTAAHYVEELDAQTLAYGVQPSWPVSVKNVTLAMERDQLFAIDLTDQSRVALSDLNPWPQMIDWAPNGAWMAYTIAGAAEGQGLYIFALDEHTLERVELPAGATEKTVFWAGAEHLFVVRQPEGQAHSELWLVSLTTGEAPRRVVSHVHLPETDMHNGWRWGDVVATQVITNK